jgi:hypothetical protein
LIIERAGGMCEILREYGAYRMAVLASNGLIQSRVRDHLLPMFI